MDHKETERDDLRYLVQPRGPGKSWVFRMLTPPDLLGPLSPWDGKPLGKEIKKGLVSVAIEATSKPIEAIDLAF